MPSVKVVGIADTHGQHKNLFIPEGDILVVAGDFCNRGTVDEVIEFNAWLGTLPHKYKVVVPGNHDLVCEGQVGFIKNLFGNATYLDMASTTILGLKFFGMPYTPSFGDWAFMRAAGSRGLEMLWAGVPADTQVLVSHGPPACTKLGRTKPTAYAKGEDAGCVAHRRRIPELPDLRVAFCGHIHEGAGEAMVCGRKYLNVSVLDEKYEKYPTVGRWVILEV